jgi:hypothetical protein
MASSFIGRSDLPRGLRNNNPGNIRSGIAWQGVTGTDSGGFDIFQDISWGIRALATDIRTEWDKGNNSISAFISIYAPPSENDTAGYISSVAADTGLDPNMPLALDEGTLQSLIRAIMNRELGPSYSAMVSDEDIDQGISMMNNPLPTFVQAAGIAVDQAIAKGDNHSGILIGVGLSVYAIYLLTRKK